MGNVRLVGQDSNVWSEPDKSDLIALQARHANDQLTAWVSNTVVHWWHQIIGKYLRVLNSSPTLKYNIID